MLACTPPRAVACVLRRTPPSSSSGLAGNLRPTGALDRPSAMALHEHGRADVALPEWTTRSSGQPTADTQAARRHPYGPQRRRRRQPTLPHCRRRRTHACAAAPTGWRSGAEVRRGQNRSGHRRREQSRPQRESLSGSVRMTGSAFAVLVDWLSLALNRGSRLSGCVLA